MVYYGSTMQKQQDKALNVQIWADLLAERDATGNFKIATTGKGDGWNVDFAVFHNDGTMDLYTMKRHLHGYIKRHYNKVPQKYLPYKWEAR